METNDPKPLDEPSKSDSPPQGDPEKGNNRSETGPRVIGTDDPVVQSGNAYPPDWKGQPDRSTVIETSRIRGAEAALNPHLIVVPVESASNNAANGNASGNGRKDSSKPNGNARNESSDQGKNDDEEGKKGSGDHAKNEHDKAGQPPISMTRMLLYSGAVALVCGIVGSAGYSYFFGPSKSNDKTSSGKDSGSGKESGSDKDSDSSKDSDSGKTSDASSKDQNSGELLQAQSAWLAAVKQLQESQAAKKASDHEEKETSAVLDFIKKTLLSAGRSGDTPISEAFWAEGQRKDLSFRKAVDQTEAQVAEAFADRPMAEARVREMLGLAYLNVGDPAQAVKQYERALSLLGAIQGVNQPITAACRNQLAVAYRLANRTVEAGHLFDRPPNSPGQANALAVNGSMLLVQKKYDEAELKLRECLNIRQKIQPNDWNTFDAKSMLGEALLDQHKFAEAEPLLVSGYDGMKQREDEIPSAEQPRLAKALERLVKLYDAWGKKDEARKWRKQFAASG